MVHIILLAWEECNNVCYQVPDQVIMDERLKLLPICQD